MATQQQHRRTRRNHDTHDTAEKGSGRSAHDQQEESAPTWGAQLGRHLLSAEADSVRSRLAPQIRPWQVAAALAGAAVAAELASLLTDRATVATIGATATWGTLAAAALVARRAEGTSRATAWVGWVRQSPRWAAVCAVTACAWLTLAMIAGHSHTDVVALAWVVALYACAARWWRTHRLDYPTGPPGGGAPKDDEECVSRWAQTLGASGARLAGSRLHSPRRHRGRTSYRLSLVAGRQTYAMVVDALDLVASALGVPAECVLVEPQPPTPTTPYPDPNELVLQVITDSPLKPGSFVPLAGPTYTRGVMELGPFADGEGAAPWRFHADGSAWGGFVLGGIGSGKSGLMEAIALNAMASGEIVVWYLDGQEGASSPLLVGQADWSATTEEEWEAMTLAVERIVEVRSLLNTVSGRSGWPVSPQAPMLLVMVDECHIPWANKVLAARWGEVARIARKCGVGIVGASQEYAARTFGDSRVLRSSLAKGNLIVMRTTEKVDTQLIPGFSADPAKLRELAGYGYRVAAGGQGRTAPFRSRWAPPNAAEHQRLRHKLTGLEVVATTQDMMATTTMPALDADSAETAGDLYRRRHERAEQRRETLLARIQQLRNGEAAAGPPQRSGVVVPLAPVPKVPAPLTVADILGPDPEHGLAEGQRAVLEAIRAGQTNISAIARAAGISRQAVYKALARLEQAGLVERSEQGHLPQRTTA